MELTIKQIITKTVEQVYDLDHASPVLQMEGLRVGDKLVFLDSTKAEGENPLSIGEITAFEDKPRAGRVAVVEVDGKTRHIGLRAARAVFQNLTSLPDEKVEESPVLSVVDGGEE
jgi:hypothetical protein